MYAEQEIDGEEAAFMLDFFSLLEAAHFRVLSRNDWDSAMDKDFTVRTVESLRREENLLWTLLPYSF